MITRLRAIPSPVRIANPMSDLEVCRLKLHVYERRLEILAGVRGRDAARERASGVR